MNTVEDAIRHLYGRSDQLNSFDRSFVENMVGFDLQSKPFTTKQLEVCLKIIGKYPYLFDTGHDIQTIIDTKRCRRTPIPSIEYVSQVRYAGGNLLILRCKYSTQSMKAIKQLDKDHTSIQFDQQAKVWCIRVKDNNLDNVMKFIQQFKIEYDDPVVAFLAECENSRNVRSSASIVDGRIQILSRNNKLLDVWLNTQVVWSEPDV